MRTKRKKETLEIEMLLSFSYAMYQPENIQYWESLLNNRLSQEVVDHLFKVKVPVNRLQKSPGHWQ
jgi:hypothetical protein